MPRTKLSVAVATEKEEKKELRDPKKMYPEFYPELGMWKVKFTGGGRIPDQLDGRYVTIGDTQKAIDLYLANN